MAWRLGDHAGEDDPPVLDLSELKKKAAQRVAYCASNRSRGPITAADKVAGFALLLFVLSHFLTANRYPLRLKML